MTHVTLPDSIRSQLGSLNEPFVLCDEAGKPLGTYTPVTELTEHQRISLTLPNHLRQSKLPLEELDRRLRDEPGIPHEEVLRKVKELL